jgi:hypothetical protein
MANSGKKGLKELKKVFMGRLRMGMVNLLHLMNMAE